MRCLGFCCGRKVRSFAFKCVLWFTCMLLRNIFFSLNIVHDLLLQYIFQPQVLCCYGKHLCTISRDAPYWTFQNRWASVLLLCFIVEFYTWKVHNSTHFQNLTCPSLKLCICGFTFYPQNIKSTHPSIVSQPAGPPRRELLWTNPI